MDQSIHQELDDYRKSIDLLDNAIVHLIAERQRVVKKVGIFKKARGIPPLAPERWEQVIESKRELAKQVGLNPDLIEDLWERIHKDSLEIES